MRKSMLMRKGNKGGDQMGERMIEKESGDPSKERHDGETGSS